MPIINCNMIIIILKSHTECYGNNRKEPFFLPGVGCVGFVLGRSSPVRQKGIHRGS